jgi:hypothetical protein
MATWKKVIVSGSAGNLTSLQVDNLTSGQVVIGGGSGNLSTTAINGTGNIAATTNATGLVHSGSFSGSFQGNFVGTTNLPDLTHGTGITAFTYDGATTATVAVSGASTLSTNNISKWTGTAFANSSLTDNGTTITGTTSLQLTGANSILTGSFTGSFTGNGAGLTGVTATPIFPTTAKTDLVSTDQFFINDGANKFVTYANLLTDLAGTNLAVEGTDSLTLATVITGITSITSTNLTGSLLGNVNGTSSWATNAINALTSSRFTVTDTTTGTGPYYLVFTDGTSGAQLPRVDSTTLTFNATTNVLTVTSSFATSASFASTAANATSASFATNATSASFATNAANATSASFATNAANATSASFATTASFATSAASATSASFSSVVGSIANNVVGNTDNRVLTATGGGTINGEANLIFDGTTLTVTGNQTVTGNLVVQGTASFQNTTNKEIADRFVLFASGSTSAGDGGIIVQQTTQNVGELFGFDSSTTRWAFTSSFNAANSAFTPDAFVSAVVVGAGTSPTAAPARYQANGNIFIGTDEGIWIYS